MGHITDCDQLPASLHAAVFITLEPHSQLREWHIHGGLTKVYVAGVALPRSQTFPSHQFSNKN